MYELRSYQERAVEEALGSPFRYEAFDMGLGKTLIMLDFLKRSGLKALVMAPLLVASVASVPAMAGFTPARVERWSTSFNAASVVSAAFLKPAAAFDTRSPPSM